MSGNQKRNTAAARLRLVAGGGLALIATAVALDVTSASSVPTTGDSPRAAGDDGGWCVTTRITRAGAATLRCVAVDDSLPGGRIAIRGLLTYGRDAETDRFATVGGTGRYRAARGTVEIDEVS